MQYKMIIKVNPDEKRVFSILELVKDREKFLLTPGLKEHPTIVCETYYEIIKELSSALILLHGFKSAGENSHKDLIDFLKNYKEISEKELFLVHDLRIRRNKSSYEGKQIEKIYLENHESLLSEIIKKLKLLINNKLQR